MERRSAGGGREDPMLSAWKPERRLRARRTPTTWLACLHYPVGTVAVSRRQLLQAALAGPASRAALPGAERDSYGGWTKKRFKKTGYFRMERDDRWWMVTPEGNAFLSFGVNHIHGGWWKAPYNGRFWAAKFGVSRPSDPGFDAALRARLTSLLPELGFNSVGVHSDLPILNTPRPFVPYVARLVLIDIPHWKTPGPDDFLDVFDRAFEEHAQRVARQEALPRRNDPMLLGYALTDCPIFTDWDAKERGDTLYGAPRPALPTFPRKLRNLDGSRPGKRAYVETVRELYRDSIADFNASYGSSFGSFDSLAAAADWRPRADPANGYETRDNTVFLLKVVERYYQVALDSIRRYDPNHLFFGDKLNGNTDTADTVVGVTSRFTDLVFYQAYGRYGWVEPSLDRWSRISGKPLFNGDGSYGTPGEHMPRPYGPLAADQRERAQWTREHAEKAFSRPDFVGWSYCGLIDSWTSLSERKQLRQHAGMMTPTGEFHGPMRDVVREIGDRLYEIAGS